jgi:hypothetical protein
MLWSGSYLLFHLKQKLYFIFRAPKANQRRDCSSSKHPHIHDQTFIFWEFEKMHIQLINIFFQSELHVVVQLRSGQKHTNTNWQ